MKTHLFKILLILLLLAPFSGNSQPFTKKYVMSFHTCDATCYSVSDHLVHLAESNDGANWTLVPNFTSYAGSVPDVVIRGSKLYLYTPGKVKRYDNSTATWDASTTMVSIFDSIGGMIQYVDPSAYIDNSGKIVLFFLNSTGNPMGQDPAGCQTYPCTKFFESATEVDGSDGTQFVKNSGHRFSYTLTSGTASDPDIFFDGSKYIMYISKGGSIYACQSDSLHGTYTVMPNLPNGILTFQGGVPCGYYDPLSGNYWTYVLSNVSGSVTIKQAIHANFNSQLNTFNIVISGPIIGEPTTTKTESPGFCVNDFLLTSVSEKSNSNINIFPNPVSDNITIRSSLSDKNKIVSICNINGIMILQLPIQQEETKIDISGFAKGVYIIKLISNEDIFVSKFVKE
jgi:hypothetical protein